MKILVLFSLLPYLVSAANILVLETTASGSHHIWMKTLLDALVEKGHNITSLSADITKNTHPNLHYLHLDKVYEVLYDDSSEDHSTNIDFFEMGKANTYMMYYTFLSYSTQILTGCIKSTGYQQLLNYPDDFKFDLVIHDYVAGPMLMNFVEKFGSPPMIGATAFYSASFTSQMVGGVLTPSFIPYPFMNVDLTTFWGRANNFLMVFLDQFVRRYYLAPMINNLLKKDFPKGTDVVEIEKMTKLVLLNKHPALDMIEHLMPNIISVGGLQIQRNKGLPQDLQKIMDEAKNGVILFSLGTNVKSEMLGEARQIEILEAFRALPQYTFIWKFEADSLPVEVPANVLIMKFVPQSDLLAHPNLKLFISHCGLLSIQEAVWYEVPILGLPVFADQFQNLKLSMDSGLADQGDLEHIERNSFKKLIEKMISDPKYRENAKIRSQIFRDQKETPLERAVWWIEFVLRHPNMTFMRSPSMDMGIATRQSWDVLAFLYSVILITVLITLKISYFVVRSCLRRKNKKSKKD